MNFRTTGSGDGCKNDVYFSYEKNINLFGFFLTLILHTVSLEAQTEDRGEDQSGGKNRLSWFAAGSIFFFPENNGVNSDPMPILPTFGAGLGISLVRGLKLEITLDMYFTTYGYNFSLDRAVPRAWENRSAFVWGSVLGIQAAYFWHLRPFMTLRAYGGPAMDARFVFVAPDLNKAINPMDEIRSETRAVRKYFWSKARWLLPYIGTGMDFNLNEKFRLGFDIRMWIPMYKLWARENAPAIDGWRFGIGARLTFL